MQSNNSTCSFHINTLPQFSASTLSAADNTMLDRFVKGADDTSFGLPAPAPQTDCIIASDPCSVQPVDTSPSAYPTLPAWNLDHPNNCAVADRDRGKATQQTLFQNLVQGLNATTVNTHWPYPSQSPTFPASTYDGPENRLPFRASLHDAPDRHTESRNLMQEPTMALDSPVMPWVRSPTHYQASEVMSSYYQ